MAIFTVVGGSFEAGPAEVTATELHVRRLSAKTGPVPTTIPLTSVVAVEIPAPEFSDPTNAVITGSVVGGLTLGVTGAISGAVVANAAAGEVTYIVRLKDRRWMMARSNRTVLRQLQRAASPTAKR
jgi:hypothetical protein